jgi:colanic acid biosynthesis glycosyl transferase WcaI
MRVLAISQNYWPESFRINDLTDVLVRWSHQVAVLTGIPNYPAGTVFPEYANNPNSYECYKGANIIRVPIVVRGKVRVQLVLNYITFVISSTVIGLFKLRKQEFDSIFF